MTKESLLEQARKAVNVDQLNKLTESIVDLVVSKNVQYGDAWQLYAILTPLIRIREKLVRAENVMLEDGVIVITLKSCLDLQKELIDSIGYGLLALLWLQNNVIGDYFPGGE